MPSGSLWRHRPARLSLARAHHLSSGARNAGIAGRNGCGIGAGRCVLRYRRRRMGLSPARASLRRSARGSGRRLRFHSRLRTARPDARARRIRRVSGGGAADRSCRRRAGDRSAAAPIVAYAADWTEYGAHVRDGGATKCAFRSIRFWRRRRSTPSASITTRRSRIGATARDHADLAIARTSTMWIICAAASAAARLSTGITPTRRPRRADAHADHRWRHGKPWVFRQKDIVSWWSNAHVERVGGVEIRTTAWVPQSKPIWLTEIGVPAVDKGTNGPNVFPDPKSSEFRLPPFSRGVRDDLMQARGLEAILSRFDPALSGFRPAYNPVSAVDGRRMIDPASISSGPGMRGRFRLSGFHLRVGGRRQLGDRALDHGQDRGRGARPADRCDSQGFRIPIPDRFRWTASWTATWSTARCRHAEPWSL